MAPPKNYGPDHTRRRVRKNLREGRGLDQHDFDYADANMKAVLTKYKVRGPGRPSSLYVSSKGQSQAPTTSAKRGRKRRNPPSRSDDNDEEEEEEEEENERDEEEELKTDASSPTYEPQSEEGFELPNDQVPIGVVKHDPINRRRLVAGIFDRHTSQLQLVPHNVTANWENITGYGQSNWPTNKPVDVNTEDDLKVIKIINDVQPTLEAVRRYVFKRQKISAPESLPWVSLADMEENPNVRSLIRSVQHILPGSHEWLGTKDVSTARAYAALDQSMANMDDMSAALQDIRHTMKESISNDEFRASRVIDANALIWQEWKKLTINLLNVRANPKREWVPICLPDHEFPEEWNFDCVEVNGRRMIRSSELWDSDSVSLYDDYVEGRQRV